MISLPEGYPLKFSIDTPKIAIFEAGDTSSKPSCLISIRQIFGVKFSQVASYTCSSYLAGICQVAYIVDILFGESSLCQASIFFPGQEWKFKKKGEVKNRMSNEKIQLVLLRLL